MIGRLLIVSQYFWPETFGINTLARKLCALGWQVTVLTGKPNYPGGEIFLTYKALGVQRELYGGVDVIRLPIVPRAKGSALRLALNYLSFVLTGYFLGPLVLRGRRFDVIFVYAPSPLLQALPAVLLARLKKVPLVVWVQDLWPESLSATGFVRSRSVLACVERLVGHIYRRSDLVLIQSEGFRQPIARFMDDDKRVRYFPNSVENPRTPPNGVATEVIELARQIGERFSVVFAGNLGTAQSLETILEAAELLKDRTQICFYMIGSGSRFEWLKDEVSKRQLGNVKVPGRFPAEVMPVFYKASAVLLVTLRDEPIFAYTIPSKLQSYLAFGRPIIASLNGEGARVVVEAKAGLVCGAGDAKALANSVAELYAMEVSERQKMAENARRYAADHFDIDHLANELVESFARLVSERREKRP